jgi:type I restriction enzyme M protein
MGSCRESWHEHINRDKASFDIFWLRDESLEGSDDLSIPMFSLKGAIEQFRKIAADV